VFLLTLEQWAKVGTIVGGFGTLLAFAGTLYLLNMQGQQLGVAQRQERDREDDRHREQARLVAAWCIGRERVVGATIAVTNRSDEPVYGCCPRVKSTWGPGHDLKWVNVGVLPPASTRNVEIPIKFPRAMGDILPPVEVTFTDSAGRHWRRRDNGSLQEAPRDRPPESAWFDEPSRFTATRRRPRRIRWPGR
jgi:hypothetical protein